jgi:uncharacterized BrkB/YihY/UPF0761 family membrane protein
MIAQVRAARQAGTVRMGVEIGEEQVGHDGAAASPEEPPAPKPGLVARGKALWVAGRARVMAADRMLRENRSRVAALDVAFSFQEGDRDTGGSLLGGAIAFRLFLWLLPAALLIVAGLGFGAADSSTGASEATRAAGITSIAAQSIDQAAKAAESARWLALFLGAFFLYFASVSLLKAFFVAHALIWRAPVPRIQHKLRTVGELLLGVSVLLVLTSLAAVIRNHSPGYGLVAMIAVVVMYGAAWWVFSLRLPHGEASMLNLLPGAALFGVGVEILHLVSVYYLAARFTHASILYGTLGAAAALLFGLYLVGRLIIGSAVLNATLWARDHPGAFESRSFQPPPTTLPESPAGSEQNRPRGTERSRSHVDGES